MKNMKNEILKTKNKALWKIIIFFFIAYNFCMTIKNCLEKLTLFKSNFRVFHGHTLQTVSNQIYHNYFFISVVVITFSLEDHKKML